MAMTGALPDRSLEPCRYDSRRLAASGQGGLAPERRVGACRRGRPGSNIRLHKDHVDGSSHCGSTGPRRWRPRAEDARLQTHTERADR
jgi:hypothetical protein